MVYERTTTWADRQTDRIPVELIMWGSLRLCSSCCAICVLSIPTCSVCHNICLINNYGLSFVIVTKLLQQELHGVNTLCADSQNCEVAHKVWSSCKMLESCCSDFAAIVCVLSICDPLKLPSFILPVNNFILFVQ